MIKKGSAPKTCLWQEKIIANILVPFDKTFHNSVSIIYTQLVVALTHWTCWVPSFLSWGSCTWDSRWAHPSHTWLPFSAHGHHRSRSYSEDKNIGQDGCKKHLHTYNILTGARPSFCVHSNIITDHHVGHTPVSIHGVIAEHQLECCCAVVVDDVNFVVLVLLTAALLMLQPLLLLDYYWCCLFLRLLHLLILSSLTVVVDIVIVVVTCWCYWRYLFILIDIVATCWHSWLIVVDNCCVCWYCWHPCWQCCTVHVVVDAVVPIGTTLACTREKSAFWTKSCTVFQDRSYWGCIVVDVVVTCWHWCWCCRYSSYYAIIILNLHLKLSPSSFWQLAWCSNWSSSHKWLSQKEHLKMRPPWSHTPLSHSRHTASIKGHVHACVVRHLRLWHTQPSQKSQIAPYILYRETGRY